MKWSVEFHDDFVPEYEALSLHVQNELQAMVEVPEQLGPLLGRPRVDTLNGSRHASMKEIRFDADGGVWRFAFAFDPNRQAIILCGGDKSGGRGKAILPSTHSEGGCPFCGAWLPPQTT